MVAGLRWFVADLRTGRSIIDIPVLPSSKWSRSLNKAEQLTAELDMQDPVVQALKPRQTMTAGRMMLCVAVGDVILGAGPIWTRDYSPETRVLTLTAAGIWSYFDHRFLLPIAAATVSVGSFIVPDPSSAGKTMPNTALGTYLTGLEYGTVAKRWVQQAQTWTGGNVPVVFEVDRVGTRVKNFEGADFKNVGTVLSQLTQIEFGPDIRFRPRFQADRMGVEFLLETGTDASPLLSVNTPATPHMWNYTVPKSGVSKLTIKEDATKLAGTAWSTAGRSADSVLVSRTVDTTLTDLGFPLFETLDSSHSTVNVQGTLDGYTRDAAIFGRNPLETWALTVEAGVQPFLGAYWEGDYCAVEFAPYNPATGVGDPYLFEGDRANRRITGIGGDANALTVDITTQAVV